MAQQHSICGVLLGICFSATTMLGVAQSLAAEPAGETQPAEIRVGVSDGDFRGSDHRALQAAVDYIAGLGGGTVRVGPGRYAMRNALTLRDHVDIVGVPGKTILAACDGFESRLAADGDCNERQITVADPTGFQVGDGVAVHDKNAAGGFTVTTATLTARLGPQTFRISTPLYLDYMVAREASAKLAFPVVGGWKVKDATVDGLAIEGQGEKSEHLDGCRGGGIFLFECEGITIRNCAVRRYNGDGISFQVSAGVTVEDCVLEDNLGIGLHPGSGSQRPVVRRNRATGNGRDGMFVCWRVKHGLFEKNELCGNRGSSISIGHKDTDNLFRENTIRGNDTAGVYFRNEDEAMGAHRNVFEANRILDNGASSKGERAREAIVMRGHHHDVVFRGNVVGDSQPGGPDSVGVRASKHCTGLKAEENEFLNVKVKVQTE